MVKSKKLYFFNNSNLNSYFNIEKDVIHIWIINTTNEIVEKNFNVYYNLLNEREKKRFERYKFNKDKRRFVFSRGILRYLISKYLNIEARNVSIIYDNRGKPKLGGGINKINLNFNISHSKDLILFVFVLDSQIGVDVEYIDRCRDVVSIARNFYNKDEYNIIQGSDNNEKYLIFYRLWTFKEAMLKAYGTGLSSDFRTLTLNSQIEDKDCSHGTYFYRGLEYKYNFRILSKDYCYTLVYH
ncbi:MAG: 4'-phosphopantetheinyl transferase superfamily protein [Deferribacterota bacterium]|nr:4'-phosphopantetheinyl transferase superfamily protein [Deferribacterota bacterium]